LDRPCARCVPVAMLKGGTWRSLWRGGLRQLILIGEVAGT
jgi:hypothetical protein